MNHPGEIQKLVLRTVFRASALHLKLARDADRLWSVISSEFLGALLCVTFALWSGDAAAQWSVTASMSTPRAGHTATLLPNGNVLVAGGRAGNSSVDLSLNTAEVFDPNTDVWRSIRPMAVGRSGHTATMLADGKVLVAGGALGGGPFFAGSTELYDPATNSWTSVAGFQTYRANHSATRLRNGKVLAVGGLKPVSYFMVTSLASAELYNPETKTWITVASMENARSGHSATLLDNGKVLVMGGGSGAEVYDPDTGKWTSIPGTPIVSTSHTATLLSNGKVVVVGTEVSDVALFDPDTNAWSTLPSMAYAQAGHSATLLGDGTILVAGGTAGKAELYDPIANVWTRSGDMAGARYGHTATLLLNGKVLAAGGQNGTSYLSSAELYAIKGNGTLPVYRFFNLNAGGHFYTINEAERNVVLENYNWFRNENIGLYAFAGQLPGTLPVYRFFNLSAGGHFYTIDESERNAVLTNPSQFRAEKIGFYAYPVQMPGTLPVYRFFNTNAGGHFYTLDEGEKNIVMQYYKWFRYEGVGFYAYRSQE